MVLWPKEGRVARHKPIQRLPGILPTQPLKREPKRSKRWPIILLLLIGVGGIYWAFFLSSLFTVQSVSVVGTNDAAVISLAERLKGENIFRIRTTTLAEDIRRAYPPVADVTVVRGLPHSVRLSMVLRKPMLRWQTPEGVYILDQNGESFSVGETEAYATLPKVLDSSGFPVKVGQSIVSPSFIDFLYELQDQLPSQFNRKVVNYEVKASTYHLDILLDGDVRLKVTVQRPVTEQLVSSKLILDAHPEVHLIDVRIPQVGYYK